MYFLIYLIIAILECHGSTQRIKKLNKFPDYFQFGIGTSAYQIEGAWNLSGKGESIWDRAVHSTPYIADRSTGDVACDSYHHLKEDIRMLQQVKVSCYRFSISWTRLFPNGLTNTINQPGMDYYNNLISSLRAVDIQPMVTLFHWDTPQFLQDLGGWTNVEMIEYFKLYADKVFGLFGDRVQVWTTFNEPANYCQYGYSMVTAPFLNSSGVGSYLCAHNIIKAHAEVYKLYQEKYKHDQKGVIGITLDSNWNEPLRVNCTDDQKAAEFAMEFYFGWFAWPIFLTGDYPPAVKQQIAQRSKSQNFTTSRLPTFTNLEKFRVRFSADYLGLNHYSSYLTRWDDQGPSLVPSRANDRNLVETVDSSWKTTARFGFTNRPESLKNLILWVGKKLGNNLNIAITENGYNGANTESLDDVERVDYLNGYVQAVLDAMNQGANVRAYTWWSLMNNFEWIDGYRSKFGLYHVDFQDSTRRRTPKKSAKVFQNIVVTRKVDPNFNPNDFLH